MYKPQKGRQQCNGCNARSRAQAAQNAQVTKHIIQRLSDLAMKVRFKHIRKSDVLGFEVEPYFDIDLAKLPFSLDNMRYLHN